jgi:hypothetical protein
MNVRLWLAHLGAAVCSGGATIGQNYGWNYQGVKKQDCCGQHE